MEMSKKDYIKKGCKCLHRRGGIPYGCVRCDNAGDKGRLKQGLKRYGKLVKLIEEWRTEKDEGWQDRHFSEVRRILAESPVKISSQDFVSCA